MNRIRDNWIQSWVSSARDHQEMLLLLWHSSSSSSFFFIYTNNLRHRVSTCLYASGKREEFPSSLQSFNSLMNIIIIILREKRIYIQQKHLFLYIFLKDVMEGSLIRFNHSNAGSYSALVFDSTRAQLIVAARYSNNSHYCVCLSLSWFASF